MLLLSPDNHRDSTLIVRKQYPLGGHRKLCALKKQKQEKLQSSSTESSSQLGLKFSTSMPFLCMPRFQKESCHRGLARIRCPGYLITLLTGCHSWGFMWWPWPAFSKNPVRSLSRNCPAHLVIYPDPPHLAPWLEIPHFVLFYLELTPVCLLQSPLQWSLY